ncbi:MAG: hypothetical protein ACJ72Z_05220 [Pyrinomonadaceae bacterium]
MNANDKARLLGLFFWLFTALYVFVVLGIGIAYLAIFGVVFSTVPQQAGDPPPELIMLIMAVAFFVALIFTILFSIPKLVAGYGLRKNKPWARTWAIIASIMVCMSFPLGTAIGVFGLVFLFSDEGRLYFDQQSYGGVLGPGQPAPNSWQ